MRVLITGGAGFIGSHLSEAYLDRGDEVTVLDDLSTGSVDNIRHLRGHARFRATIDSVHNHPVVAELVDECDVVVHLAAAVGVKLIVSQPLESLLSNVRGTDIVMTAAARHDRRLLYSSTSEVYGKSSVGPLHEGADRVVGSPFVVRWGYATAKAFGEALLHAYAREEGARFTAARLFNTVGPRQKGSYGMVLPRFAQQAIAGEDVTVYGDGTQSRCFVHVADTVSALTSLLDCEGAVGGVFNVGSPDEVSIIELARRVIERAESGSRVRLVPYEDAYGDGFEELGRRQPDTAELERMTGWTPSRSLDETIDDVIAYARSESKESQPGLVS
jgi:UDP-glucose 4-epimerase